MLNRKLVTGMLTMLVLAVTACGKPGASVGLDGTKWMLTSLNGKSPLAGANVTLAFDGGQATGSAGCNSYSGAYRVEAEDRLTFSPITSTEMACLEPPGIMEQETEYLKALGAATRFRLRDGQLEILTAEGGVLTYRPAAQ